MAITTETREDIIQLVVAAYNTAPGTELLTELVRMVDRDGATLAEVAEHLTMSERWSSQYPAFQTADEFAEEWLGQLVPEASDAVMMAGVEIVVGHLNAGGSMSELVLSAQMFLSGTVPAEYANVAQAFMNRTEVAMEHTIAQELEDASFDLSSVTSDQDTVTAAVASFDGTGGGTTGGGQVFSLTAEIDEIVGGGGDDVFNAVLSENDATWNIPDGINGGGGNDVMNVTVVNRAGAQLAFPGLTTSGIERINFRHLDSSVEGQTTRVDLASDAAQILVHNSIVAGTSNDDRISIAGIGKDTTVGVANNDSDLTVSFQGAGDEVTLALGGGKHGRLLLGETDTDAANADVTGGYETVNLVSAGAANILTHLDAGGDFETLNVSGDQNLSITRVLHGGLSTVDASAASGVIAISAVAAARNAYTGGTGGEDTLSLSLAGDYLDGKDSDGNTISGLSVSGFESLSLSITDDAKVAFGNVSAGAISIGNVDPMMVVELDNDPDGDGTHDKVNELVTNADGSLKRDPNTGDTFDLTDDQGDFVYKMVGINNDRTMTLVGAASGTELDYVGRGKATGQNFFDSLSLGLGDDSSDTDELTVNIGNRGEAAAEKNGAAADLDQIAVTSNVATLTVNVADFSSLTVDDLVLHSGSGDDATAVGRLVLNSAADIAGVMDGETPEGAPEKADLTAVSGRYGTLDASGSTGDLSIAPLTTGSATISTGSGNDVVRNAEGIGGGVSTAKVDTIGAGQTFNLGDGNDAFTIQSTEARADVFDSDEVQKSSAPILAINAGAGDDSFTSAVNVRGAITVNGGAGADSFKFVDGENTVIVAADGTETENAGSKYRPAEGPDGMGLAGNFISFNGGDGFDTLEVTAAAADQALRPAMTIAGIERIFLDFRAQTGGTFDMRLTVADGYSDSLSVGSFADLRRSADRGVFDITLALASTDGGTVDASNVSFSGRPTDSPWINLEGSAGNDTLTGADGLVNAFVFNTDTGSAGGSDTVRGYSSADGDSIVILGADPGTTSKGPGGGGTQVSYAVEGNTHMVTVVGVFPASVTVYDGDTVI